VHDGHALGTRWPWRHFVDYVAGSKVAKVRHRLGSFKAELGLGSKMKFEAHMMLYDFY
jgi:hypothetical protein